MTTDPKIILLGSRYRMLEQTHTGLFHAASKKLNAPVYHVEYKTCDDVWVSLRSCTSKSEAFKVCVQHAESKYITHLHKESCPLY